MASERFIQASFNSGEWAPHLLARTDIEKYHSGAALLRNFFVDYRGGASTRSGTKYVIRADGQAAEVRLIPFQAAISLGFILEFGNFYIRFHRHGAPVLEAALSITGATQTNPCVVSVVNSYNIGDWVFISNVGGMTQLNGKYYILTGTSGTTITLEDLFGNPVDATGYTAFTTGGTVQRIYTLPSPYAAADLALLKFTQNIDAMIFCNTNYVPYQLTFITPTSWTMSAIVFGTTISPPTGLVGVTTLAAGAVYYSYIVTSLDSNNQESGQSTPLAMGAIQDIRTTPGSNTITWAGVTGAAGYNVYRAEVVYGALVPAGSGYGFIGNCTGTTFVDSNIAPDFSIGPPVAANPFAVGSGVASTIVTVAGSYTTAPTALVDAPPAGITATITPLLNVITATVSAGGTGYAIGNTINLSNGIVLTVLTLAATAVATVTITNPGSASTLPSNPRPQVSSSGAGTGATFTLAWGVYTNLIVDGGTGYLAVPNITYSAGAAAATAVLGPTNDGNPAVPTFFQQRLVLAGPISSPETLFFSQPGNYYNFDISFPIKDDDSITASIVSGQLSNIKSMIPQPGGLIVFTDGVSYLLNGGALGAPITPSSITANAQSFLGANDMPPIVVNFDILNVQSKGSSVRDSTYNFYANVFTGADISILSSHLFFGFELEQWAWAEEPYKIVWCTRNDGTLLSLTFIKEQEFIGWAHHDTEDGDAEFKSVATIVEAATVGFQNFVYVVVSRVINGIPVQYIEYFPERAVSDTAQDYFTVDCGISYNGSPATNFQGGEFLAGKTCTGLADGNIIPPFVMPVSGDFALGTPASKVTVGLGFTAQLQTLYLDMGSPTIQSKMKSLPQITVRVVTTLGLQIGSDSSNLVPMKDLVVGNVGSMTNAVVTGLVSGDARTVLDPKWQEQGQIFIQQSSPLPATVLGIIPQITVGDTPK